jgi:hypothetical protein
MDNDADAELLPGRAAVQKDQGRRRRSQFVRLLVVVWKMVVFWWCVAHAEVPAMATEEWALREQSVGREEMGLAATALSGINEAELSIARGVQHHCSLLRKAPEGGSSGKGGRTATVS